jgi:two-component system sensor histidine kinase PilS (NtrC family)
LLDEAEQLDKADRRLLNIIQSNVIRVNKIIESILELSRRQEPRLEQLNLKTWLERFMENFTKEHQLQEGQLQLVAQEYAKEPLASVDATQLEQILENICDNALHHGERGKATRIELLLGNNLLGQHWLRIHDNGQGMPEFTREHLFEPFYTTRSDGTGLGLYIARELAEANNIFLEALPSEQGMVFQLTFRGS